MRGSLVKAITKLGYIAVLIIMGVNGFAAPASRRTLQAKKKKNNDNNKHTNKLKTY